MDGNQNEINNVGTIYCTHCGTLNDKTNNFCISCGAAINGNISSTQTSGQSNQQVNNVQPSKKEDEVNPYKGLMILLGIASIVLSLFNAGLSSAMLFVAIASLFSKTTRPYGLTVLIAFGVSMVIGIILLITFFGACFAGLGGM